MSNMPMGGPPGGMGGGMPPGGMGGGMPPGGMGGGMPPGGMGGGRHGGGPPGGPDDSGDPPDVQHMAGMLDAFTLEQRGDTLAFFDHSLRVRQILVNGGHKLDAHGADGVAQAGGRWKDGRLSSESRGPRGEKVREVWELIDEGRSLRSTTTLNLPGPMGSIEISRIYERESSKPTATPADGTGPPR